MKWIFFDLGATLDDMEEISDMSGKIRKTGIRPGTVPCQDLYGKTGRRLGML